VPSHFLRNVLAQVPKGSAEMVAATIRTIFAQPSSPQVREQLQVIAAMPGRQFPKVEAMLLDAADDITAFAAFPIGHWKKIWSTNPLERLNNEIKRRTDVAGVFPNPEALLRLAGSVLVEAHDEWQAGERRYPVRGLHDPARHPTRRPEGGSHTRTAHGIVSNNPADHNTVKITYTTPRDATRPFSGWTRCPHIDPLVRRAATAQLVPSRQPGRPGAVPVRRVCHVRRALTLVLGPCHNLPAKGRVIRGFPRNAPLGWQVRPGLSMVTRASGAAFVQERWGVAMRSLIRHAAGAAAGSGTGRGRRTRSRWVTGAGWRDG
jgi:hypothetical protein